MLLDLAESVVATGPGLRVSVGWNKYFAFIYKNSEVLRKHWRENWDYYPDTVREAFQAPSQASRNLSTLRSTRGRLPTALRPPHTARLAHRVAARLCRRS
jgi:hypothetical protein